MKKLAALLITLCALCAVSPVLAAVPEICSVDIYPSGAKFIFSIPSGPDGFRVELPGAFRANDVRPLNPEDAEDVRIVEESRSQWVPPSLEGLRAQAEAQAKAVGQLSARRAALEQTKALLERANPPDRTDARDIISYIQMAQEMKLSVEGELAEMEAKLKKENEELARLQGELKGRSPQNANSLVVLTGHSRTGLPLLFEAFTSAARWTPHYTMDLNSASGTIATRLYAKAWQRTGLDYTGPITFHTKRPDEAVASPSLEPLRVSLKPKAKALDDANYVMAEMALTSSGMLSRAAAIPEPQMETTLADRAVRGSGTLTGDGRETEFILGDLELTGKPFLVLIPEQRENAWIMVDMDAATPLIPGKAALMIDGQPAGTASLPEYGLGQQSIPFGYAQQVTAKKEPLVERTGTSWFSGVFAGGYTLEITNGMKEDKVVTVRDRLPIPTVDKVTLTVKRIEPEPKERDDQNRLTWELPVKAGETVKIVVDYALGYPSGEELQYQR